MTIATGEPGLPREQLLDVLIGRSDPQGPWLYRGQDRQRTHYRIKVVASGAVRELDAVGMGAWLRWYDLGVATAGTRLIARRRALAEVLPVLVAPTIADACRIAIRHAMQVRDMGITDLAEASGWDRKACRLALHLGGDSRPHNLSARFVGDAYAAVGLDLDGWLRERYDGLSIADAFATGGWDLRYARHGDPTAPVAPFCDAPPEPDPIRRARAAAIFHQRGLIRWDGPLDPNVIQREANVLRADPFEWTRGGRSYQVAAEVVVPALLGLGDAIDADAAAAITE